jgi:hypothetical protein
VVGNNAFFDNRSAFQRLFGYLDELRQQAEATFTEVTANLRTDGVEQMRAAVTASTAMLGKIASIQRKLDKYPKYKAALTMPSSRRSSTSTQSAASRLRVMATTLDSYIGTTLSTASRF